MDGGEGNHSKGSAAGRNVVLLTIDALRADALGCYGGRLGLSPFIDSLAARAVRYASVQATGPYTQAAFPGLLTSSHYLDHDDHGRGKTLSPRRAIVSEPLRRAGIATAAFHSNPYLCGLFGWNRGWDTFYDSMQDQVSDEVPFVQAGEINRKVDGWLAGRGAAGARPFFLWVHYMDMHEPYVPAREHLDAVDRSVRLSPQEMFGLFKTVLLPRDVSDPAKVEMLRKLYLANVRRIDGAVRELFEVLDRRGALQGTTVILTSDHGDEFGEHGGISHDGKMYSELLHVPLLVVGGDGRAARIIADPVSAVDIPPTILQLFGLPAEERFQGRPLPAEAGGSPRLCFAEAIGKRGRRKETDRPVYCCLEGSFRVSYRVEADRWELFDLAADPAETTNLIGSSERAEAMRARLGSRIGRK